MEWQVVLALTLTIPLMLFPVAYVWYLNGVGVYRVLRRGAKKLSCSVNADCPPGYICDDGKCIPAS